jgi:hypothetical protein
LHLHELGIGNRSPIRIDAAFDPTTWGDWEWTGQVPWKRYHARLDGFLEASGNAGRK